MVAPVKQAPVSNVELWALAQVAAGRVISPNLPVTDAIWSLLNDLQVISPDWRMMTIAQRLGEGITSQIKAIDVAAPMPGFQPQKNPFSSPNVPVYEPPLAVVTPSTSTPAENHLIPADDLKNLPPPKYAIDGYPIYAHSLNALVGPSGGGKSFVCIDIAGRMAIQMMQAGQKESILYVAGEGIFGYADRWEVWKHAHGLTDCPNLVFYDQAVNFLEPSNVRGFMGSIAVHQPYMIIIDTVARCMVGGDENSTRDMGLFVSSCDQIIREMKAGIIAVHHTGKDGKMRGSSALFGACDSVMFLSRAEGRITVSNSLDHGGKNKYSKEAAPLDLQLLPRTVEVGGKTFSSAILVKPSQVIESPDYVQLTENQRRVLEVLEAYDTTGLKGSQIKEMTTIPESSIWRVINSLKGKKLITSETDGIYRITTEGIDIYRRNLEF